MPIHGWSPRWRQELRTALTRSSAAGRPVWSLPGSWSTSAGQEQRPERGSRTSIAVGEDHPHCTECPALSLRVSGVAESTGEGSLVDQQLPIDACGAEVALRRL